MSKRHMLVVGMLGLAVALAATGCGGGKKEESEGDRAACKAPATTEPTGLPEAFPVPGEVTLTAVRKDASTVVVDGYWAAGIDEAYGAYKDQVEQAGYDVLFSEQEEHDAEISYKGSGRTGLIALRDDCTESDTIRVHITNRPA